MLILSRKSNEKICLADLGVTIEVIRIAGSRVSLGIRAPKSIRIVRHELEVDSASCTQCADPLVHEKRPALTQVGTAHQA